MIKANELRVGNLIQSSWKNEPHKVTSDTIYEVEDFPKAYSPIPLTEQWLLDFGFDKHPNPNGTRSWCYYKDRERWVIQSMLDLNSFSFGITPLKPELNFVHQLQNLFYTLCGKELELKSEEEIR